jgi:hypothetical protein
MLPKPQPAIDRKSQSIKEPSGWHWPMRTVVIALFALGLGIGLSIVGVHALLNWYSHRAVPTKTWPAITLSVGITAKLKTDWRDVTRYQFVVSPSNSELSKAFETAIHSGDISLRRFTLHFYDKSGFEMCKTEVLTTPTADSGNELVALTDKGDFYCSRADYLQLDRWNIQYRFPKLVADEPTPKQDFLPVSGSDRMTGFDLSSGHLEMRSGKTFLVYREGEKDTALGWSTWADVTHRQPTLHFGCDAHNECLIENSDNKQAIHGRMIH